MQEMEMTDYINEQPRHGEKCIRDTNQAERRLCQLLLLSFGVLCITQATLNLSLRLTLYSSRESNHSCNTPHFSGEKQMKDVHMDCEKKCNKLQERFNALTRDRDLLQNRNSELNNTIKKMEKQMERLKIQLRELSGCVSPQRCPPEWREINSRCYFLSKENKTWEDSRKYCQSKGAGLVVINDEQEQRAIYRLDGDVDLLFWIGLHGTDGNFKWVDGFVPTKSFWQSGQPDHGGPNNVEDCVEMYHFNPELASWNDAPCGKERRWLCEKDQALIHNCSEQQ